MRPDIRARSYRGCMITREQYQVELQAIRDVQRGTVQRAYAAARHERSALLARTRDRDASGRWVAGSPVA
jgi:hypothetical protein